jgi:hypothetical protein
MSATPRPAHGYAASRETYPAIGNRPAVLDGGPAVGLAVRVAPELVDLRAAGRVSRTVANARLCLMKGPWHR